MKKTLILLLLSFLSLGIQAGERKTCIDKNWRFAYGAHPEAVAADYDDSGWRLLHLPHDWSVETQAAAAAGDHVGPFSRNSIGKYQTGNTVGGEGWYRRTFTVAPEDSGKQLTLYFEGAYNQCDVWVNGQHAYTNPYGYSSFRVNITRLCLAPGARNVVTVRVRNEGQNTRWYAGSGIYRHVWLITTPPVHADAWDTFVDASQAGLPQTSVKVTTKVYNESGSTRKATVRLILAEKGGGRVVATARQRLKVPAHGSADVAFAPTVASMHLWSPASPYLYTATLEVKAGSATDRLVIPFGARSLSFSADKGFLLNGQPTLLRGGCVHHDNGLLGAEAYNRAEDRKLQLLMDQGFNAIRCSHNLPSEHFLDACDSLGLLVIDECFDQWLEAKNQNDYHQYFEQHSDSDLQTMIRRDRNHPSVVIWSIGNEIPGRIEPSGLAAAARMRTTVRSLDTTRPITAAICSWDNHSHPWSEESRLAFQSLDIGGYNYMYDRYERDHKNFPDRVMMGTESYAKQAAENWNLVEKHPYVIGDFVWTAADYLGEAGIGSAFILDKGKKSTMFQSYPWFNGWCGDIDLIGQKKPQSYFRDVVWRMQPITMAVERPIPAGQHQWISAWGWQLEQQSWTFDDLSKADTMTVNVYSRAPRVRLYLNGRLLGEEATSATFWAPFSVPYQPGELKAVSVEDGKETGAFSLVTTGAPAALRLSVDRPTIEAGETDLAYITIELTDDAGRTLTSCSDATVTLSCSGAGILYAAGNACPYDMESFHGPAESLSGWGQLSLKLFQGRALAIVRAGKTPGDIRLAASSEGVAGQTATIHVVGDK